MSLDICCVPHLFLKEESYYGRPVHTFWFILQTMYTKKVVSVHTMRAHRRSGCIAPHILNLGTSWEWSISGPYRSTLPTATKQQATEPAQMCFRREKPLAAASNETPDHPSCILAVTTEIKLLQHYRYVFVFICAFRRRGSYKSTRVVPKVMSNFFLHVNWEQKTKESAVVDGTSCCIILECLVTSIASIT